MGTWGAPGVRHHMGRGQQSLSINGIKCNMLGGE